MLELTDQNFEKEVLKADKIVLVDFWSPTCGPCLAMAPIVEEIANEFEGKIKVGKLNVAENMRTALRYGIRAVPTFIFFKGGIEIERIIGGRPKEFFVERINHFLQTFKEKNSQ